jgi:hypothetical protein
VSTISKQFQSEKSVPVGSESLDTQTKWTEGCKMVFTFSLYSFFIKNIPESDEASSEIAAFFTSDNMKSMKLEPTNLMYYLSSNSVTNMYSELNTNNVSCASSGASTTNNFFNQGNSNDADNSERNSAKIQVLINNLNDMLAGLSNIPEGKTALYAYIKSFWSSNLIFVCIILTVVFFNLTQFQQEVLSNVMKTFRTWITNIYNSLFGKK